MCSWLRRSGLIKVFDNLRDRRRRRSPTCAPEGPRILGPRPARDDARADVPHRFRASTCCMRSMRRLETRSPALERWLPDTARRDDRRLRHRRSPVQTDRQRQCLNKPRTRPSSSRAGVSSSRATPSDPSAVRAGWLLVHLERRRRQFHERRLGAIRDHGRRDNEEPVRRPSGRGRRGSDGTDRLEAAPCEAGALFRSAAGIPSRSNGAKSCASTRRRDSRLSSIPRASSQCRTPVGSSASGLRNPSRFTGPSPKQGGSLGRRRGLEQRRGMNR